MDEKRDFSFGGRGVIGAGDYGNLSFSGSGTATGDISCRKLECSGAFRAEGNLECAECMETSGSFHCAGNVTTDQIDSSGSVRIGGDLTANQVDSSGSLHVTGNAEVGGLDSSGSVKIGGNYSGGLMDTSGSITIEGGILRGSLDASGSVKVEKSVKAETIELSGSFQVGGDCEAERFESTGKLTIGGLLNAEEIEIAVGRSESQIGEIGGGKIEIYRKKGFFDLSILEGYVFTESVEGEDICLENTKAKVVRGARVHIGSRCEIDEVEYTESYEKADDAFVRNVRHPGEA